MEHSVFYNPIPISHRTYCSSIIDTSRLKLCRNVIGLYSVSHAQYANKLNGKCAWPLHVELGGTYSDQLTSQGYEEHKLQTKLFGMLLTVCRMSSGTK